MSGVETEEDQTTDSEDERVTITDLREDQFDSEDDLDLQPGPESFSEQSCP
jgi:hypothetical protein